MKFTNYCITIVASAILAGAASSVDEPYPAGVLKIPVRNRVPTANGNRTLSKRWIDEPLDNQLFQYVAEFGLGTPAQRMEGLIDTGSSDLWVYSDRAGVRVPYNPSVSSTSEYINSNFDIQYVSGDASGDWVRETLTMGNAQVKRQQFGNVHEKSDSEMGIFGIGMTENESPSRKYVNFPENLKRQGFISSNMYSLYLDSLEANTGSVLFGGIDVAKYEGQLTTVPLISRRDFIVYGYLPEFSKSRMPLIMDSGTSLSYLPMDIVRQIARKYNARWDSHYRAFFLSKLPRDQGVYYQFNGANIIIPISELFIPGKIFGVKNNDYMLSILDNSQSRGKNLLGDSFLRSAYVVFDSDNQAVHIAQATFSSDSKIRKFT